jgi:hypothetical protein
MEYLAGRKIALLGSDGNNDTAPSAVPGVDFPVHVLAPLRLALATGSPVNPIAIL